MRFLTREWHEGGLDDDAAERASSDYLRHVQSVGPRLPLGLRVLGEAGGEHSLHDGRCTSSSFADGTLTLVVRGFDCTTDIPVKDLQFIVTYEDAAGSEESVDEILARLSDPEAEILYAEIDVLPAGRFEHRMLLWPTRLGEIAIMFRDASVKTTAGEIDSMA